MEKPLTQLPLDFGQEPQVPGPSAGQAGEAGDQYGRQYMTTAGVGVRVKAYKNPATSSIPNGDLFAEPVADHLPELPHPIAVTPLPELPAPIQPQAATPITPPIAASIAPNTTSLPTQIAVAAAEKPQQRP